MFPHPISLLLLIGIITVQGKPQYFYAGAFAITINYHFMNIEFNTAPGLVSQKIIQEISNALMELYHSNKKISGAEVLLQSDKGITAADNKICRIRLSIFGENLLVQTREESFEAAARESIIELKRLLKQQDRKQNEPAEQIVSSVKP